MNTVHVEISFGEAHYPQKKSGKKMITAKAVLVYNEYTTTGNGEGLGFVSAATNAVQTALYHLQGKMT